LKETIHTTNFKLRNNRGDIYHIPKRGDLEVGGRDVGNLYNIKHPVFRLPGWRDALNRLITPREA
jgi:hypothetical protein